MLISSASGAVTNQGLILTERSKCHLSVCPRRSRCSPHAGDPTLALSHLVPNDRHETANRAADDKPTMFFSEEHCRSVECPLSGQWDQRAGKLGTDAGRNLCILTVIHPQAAVLSSELENGRVQTNARVLEAVTMQNRCSLLKYHLSAVLLEHPESALGPQLPITPTHL